LRGFITAISEAAGLEKFVRIGSRILRGGGGLLAMLCGLWVRVIDAVVLLETFVGKIAVFNRIGDSIFSHSTRSLGNSVKDACAAILRDWQAHLVAAAANSAQTVTASPPAAPDPPDPVASFDASDGKIPALGISAAVLMLFHPGF
jgi:hypothetical protein